MDMKTVLVLAAAFGLSVSAAAAECAGHSKVSASIDTETKVASVAKDATTAPASQIVVKEELQQAEQD
jgi:hypothetical protein